MNNYGIIHSTESFGASDGPGIRFIIFFKGCNLRCKYCHNPDTWQGTGSQKMTADELLDKAEKYRSYWKNNGGITVSGGEPLLQIDFLTELFKKAKERKINTCIDTAGEPFCKDAEWLNKFSELMKYTDLVMLDIKQIDNEKHTALTGKGNQNILEMAKWLSDNGKKVWIRYVLVPTVTDDEKDLTELRSFLDEIKTIEKIDILPYHTLGKYKWEQLGLEYSLENIAPPSPEQVNKAKKILLS